MHHIDGEEVDNIFYWITLICMFVFTKISGVFGVIHAALPEVEIPTHDIQHLPQMDELIPTLVVAALCAVVSALINKIVGLLWHKFIVKKK